MKKLFVFSFVVLISSPILAQGGPGGGGGGGGAPGGGDPAAVGPSIENWINHLHCTPGDVVGDADYKLTPDASVGIFSQVSFDLSAFDLSAGATHRDIDTEIILPNWTLPPDEPDYTEGSLEADVAPLLFESGSAALASGTSVLSLHDFSSAPTPIGKPKVEVVFERAIAVPNTAVGGWNIQVRGRAINPAVWDSAWTFAVKKKTPKVGGGFNEEWVECATIRDADSHETNCDTLAVNALPGTFTGTGANGDYFEIMWYMVDQNGKLFGFEKGKAYVD